ncbi:MAG: hypothetical protein IBX72_15800 [Nitrospirae bacterium]|nr:hypothetical protein [Nitrospirota bacterium]
MLISKAVLVIAVLSASVGGYVMVDTYQLKPGEVITPLGIQNKSQVREIGGVVISVEPSALSMAKGESKVLTVSILAKNLTENIPLTLGIQEFPTEQLPGGITAEFNPAAIILEPDQKTSSNLTLSIDQTAEEGKYKLRVIVSSDTLFSTVGRDIIDLTIKS